MQGFLHMRICLSHYRQNSTCLRTKCWGEYLDPEKKRKEKKSLEICNVGLPFIKFIRVTNLSFSSTQMLVSARFLSHFWLRTNFHAFLFITQEVLLQMIKQWSVTWVGNVACIQVDACIQSETPERVVWLGDQRVNASRMDGIIFGAFRTG